jgi:hypothetical protein
MRILAVARPAPSTHNDNIALFIGDFRNQPRRTTESPGDAAQVLERILGTES